MKKVHYHFSCSHMYYVLNLLRKSFQVDLQICELTWKLKPRRLLRQKRPKRLLLVKLLTQLPKLPVPAEMKRLNPSNATCTSSEINQNLQIEL